MAWAQRLRELVIRILVQELRRPRSAAVVFALALSACMGAGSPRGKLDDAAQEMNMAARFGRTDIAIERVAPSARAAFVKAHRLWGSDVRIVDVEFGGVEKYAEGEAIILVGFGWFRPNEGTLRATQVRQTWKNDKGTGPWFLVSEERAAGDVGLLGEPPVVVLKPEAKKAQFETTVIK